jgi:heptosyltransferase-2
LLTTPLLSLLRKNFPSAKISIGIGDWAMPLLENNPHVDEIMPCNGPWHNKQICNYPANSIKTYLIGLMYIIFSKEVKNLSKRQFSHGIDFLGSKQGSLLLKRIGVKNRYGIKGYAGGHKWCTKYIHFKINQHVSVTGLSFIKLINDNCLIDIEPRPRIYLTKKEIIFSESMWNFSHGKSPKVVIAPGAGFPEKSWGDNYFAQLTKLILDKTNSSICIIGSNEDENKINISHNRLRNLCGRLELRETAALVSKSDLLISNSSLAMHLAGAFQIPSITTLGHCYDSALLHHKQWGYPENIILGKEVDNKIEHIAKVEQVYEKFKTILYSKRAN